MSQLNFIGSSFEVLEMKPNINVETSTAQQPKNYLLPHPIFGELLPSSDPLNHHTQKFIQNHENQASMNNSQTSPGKNYCCQMCNFSTDWKSSYSRHITSEPGSQNHQDMKDHFPCSECSFTAKSRSALQNHIRAVHEHKKAFKCEHCNFSTSWRLSYQRHMNTLHNVQENSMSAQQGVMAVKSFAENPYAQHQGQLHPALQQQQQHLPLPLQHHGHQNSQQQDQQQQNPVTISVPVPGKKTKTGKKYQCSSCDFETQWRDSLLRHNKTRHPGQVHSDKSNRNSNYKSSKKSTQEHVCEKCQFTTNWKDSYLRHVRTQHGDKNGVLTTFKCQLCDFSSSYKDSYVRHLRGKHRIESSDGNAPPPGVVLTTPKVSASSEPSPSPAASTSTATQNNSNANSQENSIGIRFKIEEGFPMVAFGGNAHHPLLNQHSAFMQTHQAFSHNGKKILH